MQDDPVDRLIVATALEGHRLVTADRRVLDWPGNLPTPGACALPTEQSRPLQRDK